jgi:hypothetical protein
MTRPPLAVLVIALLLPLAACDERPEAIRGPVSSNATQPHAPTPNHPVATEPEGTAEPDPSRLVVSWTQDPGGRDEYPRALSFAAWDDGLFIIDRAALCAGDTSPDIVICRTTPLAIERLLDDVDEAIRRPEWQDIPKVAFAPDQSHHWFTCAHADTVEFGWATYPGVEGDITDRADALRLLLCALDASSPSENADVQAIARRLAAHTRGLRWWIEGELERPSQPR